MAKEKNSFILYCEFTETFEALTDEQAGRLVKHIFRYVNDQEPESNDPLINVAFIPIKQRLKRDLKEWEDSKNNQSSNGKLGNLKKWHKGIYERFKKGEINLDEALDLSKKSQPDKVNRNPTENIAGVAVTVPVPVTVTVTEEKEESSCHKYKTCDYENAERLFNKILNNNPKHKKPKLENWADDFRLMREVDKRLDDDVKKMIDWCQEDSFWMANILSAKKLREKFDQLLIKSTRKNEKSESRNDEDREFARRAKEIGL